MLPMHRGYAIAAGIKLVMHFGDSAVDIVVFSTMFGVLDGLFSLYRPDSLSLPVYLLTNILFDQNNWRLPAHLSTGDCKLDLLDVFTGESCWPGLPSVFGS